MQLRNLEAYTNVPSGWTYGQSVTLLSPDHKASLIVANEPIDATVNAETYAGASLASMRRQLPGFEELQAAGPPIVLTTGEAPAHLFSWTSPDGQVMKCLQLYAVQDGRGFTVAASCAGDDWNDFEELFWQTIRNMQIPDALPTYPSYKSPLWRDEGFGGQPPGRSQHNSLAPPLRTHPAPLPDQTLAPSPPMSNPLRAPDLPSGDVDGYPDVAVPGRPPPALPSSSPVRVFQRDDWDAQAADPMRVDTMPQDAIGIQSAMTATPPSDWVAASELTLTGPTRFAPPGTRVPSGMEVMLGPDDNLILVAEQRLRIVARRVRRNSFDPDAAEVSLQSRLRVLHRRLLADHPAPIGAEWVELDSTPAVLDRFTTEHDGPMTAFQLSAVLGDDEGLVVTASAPPGRADVIAEPGLAVAMQARSDPPGPGLRWVRTPTLVVHESLQFATRHITAFAELKAWSDSPDRWRDHVFQTGPFLRGAKPLGDSVVHIHGFGDVRLERIDWQPSGRGRLLTSIAHGVAHDRAFWFAFQVSLHADDAFATDPVPLLRSISIDPRAW